MIEFRMYEKEFLNTMEKSKKEKYKPLPSYLVILQQILLHLRIKELIHVHGIYQIILIQLKKFI